MRFWKAFVVFIALAALTWFGVCRPYSIPMGGMEPTLYKGDKVLVLKRWCDRALRPGDIVVYSTGTGGDTTDVRSYSEQCVARIAGMPGDTLTLDSAMRMIDAAGKPVAYTRELYTYDSSYDRRIAQQLTRHDFGSSELLGYSGDNFVRALTRQECEFLKRANPDDLDIRPVECNRAGETVQLVIPTKGERIDVTPDNIHILCQALTRFEHCTARVEGDKLIVNGQPAAALIFGRDYYWLQSVNVMDLNDSRQCGIMPRSAFDGRVALTLFSWSPIAGTRWDRLFRSVQ